MTDTPWSRDEFHAQLLAKADRYHIHHPFNIRLNTGRCSKAQVQGWVANRFYYQWCIPLKDAAILSNCPDRETRRRWLVRLLDHDGFGEFANEQERGGLEAWTRLGEAVGIPREELWSLQRVEPGVKFACDAYVNFARQQPWQESVCASLTELFAPAIHQQRLATWPEHYPWIESAGLQYFRQRIPLAQRDVEHGLEVTFAHFNTRALQQRALAILDFKLDILWSMLDAIALAYPDEAGLHG